MKDSDAVDGGGATGLRAATARMSAFVVSVLRGFGQVMFQENAYAGALFLAGIACTSAVFGAAALLGTAAGTAAAVVAGADRALVRSGVFGFNGCLVGIALLYFLEPGAVTWLCVVLAAVCSTVVMAAMLVAFDARNVPPLTTPFVFVSLCTFLTTARFGRLQPTGLLPTANLPRSAAVEGVVTAATLGEGLVNGIAQIFFQSGLLPGVLFIAGLLVASRGACAAALLGSLTGMLVAWGMGAAESAIRTGVFGFNSALTAIALASVFLTPSRAACLYAWLAALVAPFVAAATAAALEPLGMPALTLPFVLVTWTFLLAGRAFPALGAGAPESR